jgi:hypothetical protein
MKAEGHGQRLEDDRGRRRFVGQPIFHIGDVRPTSGGTGALRGTPYGTPVVYRKKHRLSMI